MSTSGGATIVTGQAGHAPTSRHADAVKISSPAALAPHKPAFPPRMSVNESPKKIQPAEIGTEVVPFQGRERRISNVGIPGAAMKRPGVPAAVLSAATPPQNYRPSEAARESMTMAAAMAAAVAAATFGGNSGGSGANSIATPASPKTSFDALRQDTLAGAVNAGGMGPVGNERMKKILSSASLAHMSLDDKQERTNPVLGNPLGSNWNRTMSDDRLSRKSASHRSINIEPTRTTLTHPEKIGTSGGAGVGNAAGGIGGGMVLSTAISVAQEQRALGQLRKDQGPPPSPLPSPQPKQSSVRPLPGPYGHPTRIIGLNAQKVNHEITLPQFEEYPIFYSANPVVPSSNSSGGVSGQVGAAAGNSNSNNNNISGGGAHGVGGNAQSGQRDHARIPKPFIDVIIENPQMFEQQFPLIVPVINNEPVAMKLLHLYSSRWTRKSIRSQLPVLTSDNINVFLFHLARIGDLEALKVVCKSPKVDLEASDDAGRTALIFAAIGGHAQCVRLLASFSAFINRQDRSGRTALHWAAYHGCLPVAKELGDSHADMLHEDFQGKSPIHCATYPETIETLEYLVRAVMPAARRGTIMSLGPAAGQRRKTIAGLVFPEDKSGPCNAVDLELMTPLMWAAYHGHDKHIEVLLTLGRASAFMQDTEGKTALHWATSNRHGRCCEILLAKFPALINITDKMGRVPLHYAAGEGNIAVVEILLRAPGSNANAFDGLKRTPLHWAAVKGQPACINLLCLNGANINLVDDHGASPLFYAIQERNMDCIHVLLRKGAQTNLGDTQGRTPMMWASLQGNMDALKMLIKGGAKVTMKDKMGMTAIHHAAYGGHTACCTLLIRSGAQLDIKDKSGHTPLFKAAMLGWENVVLVLANENANVEELDAQRRTAAHWAASGSYTNILQLLLSHGAGTNVQDAQGRTPLHEAALSGCVESVVLLLDNDADPNIGDATNLTPLHLAASRGNVDVLEELLTAIGNINARDGKNFVSVLLFKTQPCDCYKLLTDSLVIGDC
eukprot:jgi/Hompol1/5568/HPOL_000420-RA